MFLTWANGITVFRLALFAWFVVLVGEERLPLAALIFFIVWALDAVDGFVARTLGQASEAGSLFDKVSDRVMLIGALLTLLAYGAAPAWVLFLLTKDIRLMLVLLFTPPAKRQIDIGMPGKIATFLQGGSLLAIMLQWPYTIVWVGITALFGLWISLRKMVVS